MMLITRADDRENLVVVDLRLMEVGEMEVGEERGDREGLFLRFTLIFLFVSSYSSHVTRVTLSLINSINAIVTLELEITLESTQKTCQSAPTHLGHAKPNFFA